jgi:hypothetical protein
MGPAELRAVFQNIDDLHFDGLLKRCGWRIKSGCLHDDTGPLLKHEGDVASYVFHQSVWGLTMHHARTIVLDHRLLNEEPALRMVLLHEMVHAKLTTLGSGRKRCNPHGRRFVQELRRLLDSGEECLRSEVKFYAGARSANGPQSQEIQI